MIVNYTNTTPPPYTAEQEPDIETNKWGTQSQDSGKTGAFAAGHPKGDHDLSKWCRSWGKIAPVDIPRWLFGRINFSGPAKRVWVCGVLDKHHPIRFRRHKIKNHSAEERASNDPAKTA